MRHVDWIGLAQDRGRWRKLVSAVMNLRVPWNAGNFLTSCKPVSFSGRTLHQGVSKQVSKNSSGREISPSQRPLSHNTHNRQTSIPPAGFEPSFPPSEQSQTHAIERAATRISRLQIVPLAILCTDFSSIAFLVYYRMLTHQSDSTFVYIPNILRITMSGFGASVNGSGDTGGAPQWPVCSAVDLPGWCRNQRHKKYEAYACRLCNWLQNHSSARPTGHLPGWRNNRFLS